MGKKKQSSQPKSSKKNYIKEAVVDSDDNSELNNKSKSNKHHTYEYSGDDNDEEEEVLNLAIGDHDDEDSDKEVDINESDEDENDEDEDDYSDEENDLKQLVNNLPDSLRQKILRNKKKNRNGDDDDDDNVDLRNNENEVDDNEASWGKKKNVYWTGDTADLEIGQDFDDAEDEELAAMEMHQQKVKNMKESDFLDNLDDESDHSSDSDDEDEQEKTVGSMLKGKKNDKSKNKKNSNKSKQGLELIALGNDEDTDMNIEKITQDLDKLNKTQRMKILTAQSPELLDIVKELTIHIDDLKGRIEPIKDNILKIKQLVEVDDEVIEYLEAKQQILMCYCLNVVFYLYMKCLGQSVRSHPVMKQLLKLRYLMEKMRPLDGKLKHQIDRMVKLASTNPNDVNNQSLRPNLSNLLGNDDNEASEDEEEEDNSMDVDDEDSDNEDADDKKYKSNKKASSEVYKAPKLVAMPYKENESEITKRENRLEKQRKKLKQSELMDTLREEFGTAPETVGSSGIAKASGDLKRLAEEAEERNRFEEERFIRMTMSRKDKKDNKRRMVEASRLDNFDDIGDVDDFEELSKLVANSEYNNANRSDAKKDILPKGGLGNMNKSALALQQAIAGLTNNKSKKSKKNEKNEDDFSDNRDSKRRPAPSNSLDDYLVANEDYDNDDLNDNDDGNDGHLFSDYQQKKKSFKELKKAHYTAEPRYGGYEDPNSNNSNNGNDDNDNKRGVTYEIIKNKGLTPHRKKENRNPRVAKREKFRKAEIAQGGQIRRVITGVAGAYGGETTGIKNDLSRSRKIPI
eukprot:gene5893-8131_t